MTLLIDNYDSFSYNLYQMVGKIDPDIRVVKNDELSVEEIENLKPKRIILSPGPGRPEDAGVTVDVVALGKEIPLLGVCLGHQAICSAFGANVIHAKEIMHGKQSLVKFDLSCPLFKGISEEEKVGRYHSLAVDAQTLPDDLVPVAFAEDGEIMAVQHSEFPIFGVQFHPESILTPCGLEILNNFIKEI